MIRRPVTNDDAYLWTVWQKDGDQWNTLIEATWNREPLSEAARQD